MKLRIVCSGYIVRFPIGGLSWHHLQYLVGFQQLGHDVTFVEGFGWEDSCFDPARNAMTGDPSYGIEYLNRLLRPFGLDKSFCYLAADGTTYGMSRQQVGEVCRESDLFVDLSRINDIPETAECPVRILVDTDPVFTQIGAHGMGGAFDGYDALFTFGENVHRPNCSMPTAGERWLPTRQPVVLGLWPATEGKRCGPLTTIMSWSPYGDGHRQSPEFGQKDRSFTPYFSLPRDARVPMVLATVVPDDTRRQLQEGGWELVDPLTVTGGPTSYQRFLRASRAEFSVAKHGYVSTRSGWFSERSTGYMACGRPVLVEDTGFSDWLEAGEGVLPFSTEEEALASIEELNSRYESHCKAARALVEEFFDSRKVLSALLDRSAC